MTDEHQTESQLAPAEVEEAMGSTDPQARAQALLRARREAGLERVLVQALEDDEPRVRRAAVRALAALRGLRGTRALMQVAAHDLSGTVRAEAIAALGRILETRAPDTSALGDEEEDR
ncbi:MAG TPA: HEAT repeat domain-containing protein [Actinomycetota bacterium]|nr:HEAT repeat domain-containing protein [Actinomycetota bacterium]